MRKVVVFLLLLGLIAVGCRGEPEFNGTLLPEPQPAPDFTLTGGNGREVSLSDFEDEVVLIYFGYTFCPDACPTTLAELRRVQEALDGEPVQVLLVSVDPARDTPQIAHEYASGFHPDFVGLSGSEEEIAQVASDWGVFYEAVEPDESGAYLVDHTSRVFVVDRAGRYRLSFPFATPPDDIIADVEQLLEE